MKPTEIILALTMLASGTINTIVANEQDNQVSKGRDGVPHKFQHPIVQTLAMFIGEFSCLFVFLILRAMNKNKHQQQIQDGVTASRNPPFYIFALPALCDMTATTLMYVGLPLTTPSVYQMLRGMIVVFTGIFSRIFLKRQLRIFHWLGMLLIIVGTGIVGLSSVLNDKSTAKNPLLGDVLIIGAQLVAATQMVVEEKLVGKFNAHPLQVVGSEGTFGFLVVLSVLVIGYFIPHFRAIEDGYDAIIQIGNSWQLILLLVGGIVSIAVLNFSGISITQRLSATHRTTIDATRVFIVWLVSMLIGWEHFYWMQLGGFVVLLCGTAIYNEILPLPYVDYAKPQPTVIPGTEEYAYDEKERLIADKHH